MKRTVVLLGLAMVLVGCGGNTTTGNDSVLGDRSRPSSFGDNAAGAGAHGAMAGAAAPKGMTAEQTEGSLKFVKLTGPGAVESLAAGTDSKTAGIRPYQAVLVFDADASQGASTVGAEMSVLGGKVTVPCQMIDDINETRVGIFQGLRPNMKDGEVKLYRKDEAGNRIALAKVKVTGLQHERQDPYAPKDDDDAVTFSGGAILDVSARQMVTDDNLDGKSSPEVTFSLSGGDTDKVYAVSAAVLQSTWTDLRPASYLITATLQNGQDRILPIVTGLHRFADDMLLSVQLKSKSKAADVSLTVSGVTMVVKDGKAVGLDFSKAKIEGDEKGMKIGLPNPPVVMAKDGQAFVKFPGVGVEGMNALSLWNGIDPPEAFTNPTKDGFKVDLVPVKEGLFSMKLTSTNSWEKTETKQVKVSVTKTRAKGFQ